MLPPCSAHGPPGPLGQEIDREGRTQPDMLTLSPHTKKSNPPGRPKIVLTVNDLDLPQILIPNVAQHAGDEVFDEPSDSRGTLRGAISGREARPWSSQSATCCSS
jgi:hypothetical protein